LGEWNLPEAAPSRYSKPMPIGEDSPSRSRNLPVALSMAVAVIGAQMRCTSWSM
jgi:hypothetical protein